jgi:cytochrome c oxidase assembly factor CtaG
VLYFVTGVLLWWPVVHGALTPGLKAAYVFAAFLLASPIGLVMALVPEPIYDFYADGPGLWGLSPLTDQQIAGMSMSVAEAIVFFAAFALYFRRFFTEQDAAG